MSIKTMNQNVLQYTVIFTVCITTLLVAGCNKKPTNRAMASYDRQLENLKKNSLADSVYEELGSFNIKVMNPQGITVDNQDNIYVVGEIVVQSYSPSGTGMESVFSEDAGYAVAVGEDNRIYEATQDAVHVYEADGSNKSVWESRGVRARFTSISVFKDDVYVADAGNKVFLHYNTNGDLLEIIGEGELIVPSRHLDVYAISKDSFWGVNPGKHTLSLYKNGKVINSWGSVSASKEGFSGCCNPTDFTMTKNGYFVTAEKGLSRVKLYDSSGKLECIIAGPESFGESNDGLDVAVDSAGRVLILDKEKNAVRIFVKSNEDKN